LHICQGSKSRSAASQGVPPRGFTFLPAETASFLLMGKGYQFDFTQSNFTHGTRPVKNMSDASGLFLREKLSFES
jgi:hypothetical protein